LKELHLNMNGFTGTLHTSLGMLTELSKKKGVIGSCSGGGVRCQDPLFVNRSTFAGSHRHVFVK
jgi:hypothetical protein